jgi:hypothetical protein
MRVASRLTAKAAVATRGHCGRVGNTSWPPFTADKRLSDEQLIEVLELVKGADSVELKLTVPESDHRGTIAARRSSSSRAS